MLIRAILSGRHASGMVVFASHVRLASGAVVAMVVVGGSVVVGAVVVVVVAAAVDVLETGGDGGDDVEVIVVGVVAPVVVVVVVVVMVASRSAKDPSPPPRLRGNIIPSTSATIAKASAKAVSTPIPNTRRRNCIHSLEDEAVSSPSPSEDDFCVAAAAVYRRRC
jgi:asparagine N-glycosylation enzyme membrane subunit Stt3